MCENLKVNELLDSAFVGEHVDVFKDVLSEKVSTGTIEQAYKFVTVALGYFASNYRYREGSWQYTLLQYWIIRQALIGIMIAARVMYDFAEIIGRSQPPGKAQHYGKLQAQCYLAAIHMLELAQPRDRWLHTIQGEGIEYGRVGIQMRVGDYIPIVQADLSI
jgi:hypothetical protein